MASVRVHAKFLILILGILTISFGVISTVVVRRETRLLARTNAEREHLLARTIVADLTDNMLAGRPRSTQRLIESLQGAYGLVRVAVLQQDGLPAFGGSGERVSLPEVGRAFRSGGDSDFDLPGAPPLHINLFPLRNEHACRRCHAASGKILGVIFLAHSLEDTLAEIQASRRNLVVLFLAMVIATGAGLYFAVRRVVLGPLRILHQGAELIGGGMFGHRIDIRSNDEFEELAATVNAMAGHLKESYGELENRVRIRTTELHESVRLMRGILSSMSSGVALLAADGTVKLMNRQGAIILGRGSEDVIGAKLPELAPETAVFLSGRAGTYGEITVRTPAGTAVPVGYTSSVYAAGDAEQEGIIVVFQDLTELKALQAELIDKERFASVGRVVAGVAHEIRNPLFGISGIGQIFERDLQDPAHQELARALIAETKRLNRLVEDLLIYGRPMKLKRERADLLGLWGEVLEVNRDELAERNITIEERHAQHLPEVSFDVYQMRQVFLNLLRNAIEAMPDGGTISASVEPEDGFLRFRISDSGPGIPKDRLAHVFDLFFTTKPKGTGLGLAICRRILQDHGGDIAIDSEEGVGTVVTVRLPRQT